MDVGRSERKFRYCIKRGKWVDPVQAPRAFHLSLLFSLKPTRDSAWPSWPSAHHTLVEQIGWWLMGASRFGGHFCFIACWQVVQNGARVFGGAQPQVHVNFGLYWPTSRPFSRKLGKGYKEDCLISRNQMGLTLRAPSLGLVLKWDQWP